jgi:2-C-methyl-D-erythritol 4-phosphate cytidylyltransferase/2-C-methyl-D-erythritol 2,4-cyclodiphosphate synthase
MTAPKIAVLIVAAGRGTRLGEGLPKQYRPLLGKTILAHAIEGVRQALPTAIIRCVIAPGDEQIYLASAGPDAPATVPGGASRQQSVCNGLEALADASPDIVLIHDAARPFGIASVAGALVEGIAAGAAHGVAPGIELPDSLRRAQDGTFVPVPREGMWRVQTPQAFRYRAILDAHRKAAGQQLTDDLSVAEAAGLTITLIPGDERAIKITTAADITRAEAILLAARGDVRVGHGYDVHAFGPGDSVMLCGVQVPHSAALAGHSDADVGLHALTDAILGSIGAADIGAHFPPSDPRWRGAASDAFLRHAASLVAAKDGVIAHVDVTLVCEAPKIAPHREAMVASIAAILGLSAERVSVKATTTEGLGFTGRREGIAAYATATVRLPQ